MSLKLLAGTEFIRTWKKGDELTVRVLGTLVGTTIETKTANLYETAGTIMEKRFIATAYIARDDSRRAYAGACIYNYYAVDKPVDAIVCYRQLNKKDVEDMVVYVTKAHMEEFGQISLPFEHKEFEKKINDFLKTCKDENGKMLLDTSVQVKRAKKAAQPQQVVPKTKSSIEISIPQTKEYDLASKVADKLSWFDERIAGVDGEVAKIWAEENEMICASLYKHISKEIVEKELDALTCKMAQTIKDTLLNVYHYDKACFIKKIEAVLAE